MSMMKFKINAALNFIRSELVIHYSKAMRSNLNVWFGT